MNDRAFLRHTVATLAYRSSKAMRGAPPSFADFRIGDPPKTPVTIVAHMGDLFDWALSLAVGKEAWHNAPPQAWDDECARFFTTLAAFDAHLASDKPIACTLEKLFQGPIADALTHTGQLAMLRRLAGAKITGENYSVAEITAGRVGAEQTEPRKQF